MKILVLCPCACCDYDGGVYVTERQRKIQTACPSVHPSTVSIFYLSLVLLSFCACAHMHARVLTELA